MNPFGRGHITEKICCSLFSSALIGTSSVGIGEWEGEGIEQSLSLKTKFGKDFFELVILEEFERRDMTLCAGKFVLEQSACVSFVTQSSSVDP